MTKKRTKYLCESSKRMRSIVHGETEEEKNNIGERMYYHHQQYSSENLLLIFSIRSVRKNEHQRPNSLTTEHR